MIWPCGCGASRRVLTSSSDSTSRLIASLAAAISAAVICAKSFFCSSSRSDTVSRASISTSLAVALQLLQPGEQRLLDALRAGARLVLLARRRLRHHRGDQLVEIVAAAEEDAERLVEQLRVLVALHEHRMQRPVEILARADAGRLAPRRAHRAPRPARPECRPRATRARSRGCSRRAGRRPSALTPPPAAPRAPRRAAPSPWCLRCARCRPGT